MIRLQLMIALMLSLFSIEYPAKQDVQSATTISASDMVRQLKGNNGVLLVRLHTSEAGIQALRKQGEYRLADEKRKAQLEENRTLMDAFRKEFSFCNVYFFYSNHTDDVMNGRWQGIFLNPDLQEDSSIRLAPGTYFAAEFGEWQSGYDNSSRRGLKLMNENFRDLSVEGLPQHGFFWQGQLNWRKLRFVTLDEMVATLDNELQRVYHNINH